MATQRALLTPEPVLWVVSGAGLSAESGLPTFRDADGLWGQFDINEVCNALTWKHNRERVFDFYRGMREAYFGAQPNAAHRQLAEWQARWGAERVHLLTQNIDLLLEAAGASAVTHLHGRLDELHCTACGTRWQAELDIGARCPKCTSLRGVKPGVVMFNERAPQYSVLVRLHKTLRPHDVVVFAGTAMEVLSAQAIVPARLHGSARIVNVNPLRLPDPAIGTHIEHAASAGLPLLETALQEWMDEQPSR